MAARDIIQAAAGAAGATEAVYIEDVMATYLYTGNGSTQTINNGIDLATKGGLVWLKSRSSVGSGAIIDTARGRDKISFSSDTASYTSAAGKDLSSFNTDGFSLGLNYEGVVNSSGDTFASWTFRKQAKFFDVVTYTGTGSARTVAHNLGVTPGMVIVKRTNAASTVGWFVWHKSLGSNQNLFLNRTDGVGYDNGLCATLPTSTDFNVNNATDLNASGSTYVAYLFADSNSGGFGPAGTDSVVACGSYAGTGASGNTINLGWEPQFVLIKATNAAFDWSVQDVMRGMSNTDNAYLRPNLSDAEANIGSGLVVPTATGFTLAGGSNGWNGSGYNYIYLAIRRGPMKTPTDATKVFAPVAYSGTNVGYRSVATTNTPDTVWWASRNGLSYTSKYSFDRLRGVANTSGGGGGGNLAFNASDAESPNSAYQIDKLNNKSVRFGSTAFYGFDQTGLQGVLWSFTRAPGFFDVVCYTGTGVARTVAHNLGVAPELLITKPRSAINPWFGGSSVFNDWSKIIQLNSTGATFSDTTLWNATAPTSSNFSLGTNPNTNQNGTTFIAYLFATCPGVSKVGSYTGTGAAQNIDCGFAAGARFVLIKCSSSTGSWWVFDTARGISSVGADPGLQLNSTSAENTSDWLNAYSGGFGLNSSTLNDSGQTFIYLAIA